MRTLRPGAADTKWSIASFLLKSFAEGGGLALVGGGAAWSPVASTYTRFSLLSGCEMKPQIPYQKLLLFIL